LIDLFTDFIASQSDRV